MLNIGRVILSLFLITIGILRLERDGLVWQAEASFFFAIFNLIPVSFTIADKIFEQITLHREESQRRRKYEQFKADVKSGLLSDEQAENEARRVIK